MPGIHDINPIERKILIANLTQCLGTMMLEHQQSLLEYFVDALLSCGVKPEEVIFYRRDPSGTEWHGIQLGSGQSFGLGVIHQASVPRWLGLRIEARSINCLDGSWLFSWDTVRNCLRVSRNNEQDHIKKPGLEHIVSILEDIVDGPQVSRSFLLHWLKTKRQLTDKELEQQSNVVDAFIRSAVLLGLGPKLQPLTANSYGFDQGIWHWRRTLKLMVVGSNRLLLTSQGLPVSSADTGRRYDELTHN